jgi:hypothetical protein
MLSEEGLSNFYSFLSVCLMIEFDEGWCMDLIGIFPGVVAFGIALPFDQILQGLTLPPGLVGTYLFHFVFFFAINQIQWRSGEVKAVRWCFSVCHYQTGVEHWMYAPLSQKLELDCHR